MPSGYVVVYGHGEFTPSSDTPLFSVPDNTQVTFITEPLKTLYMDSGELMSEWTAADLESNAVQWVDADRSCFNYTITPDSQAIGLKGRITPPDSVEFEIIEAEESLQSIVSRHAGKTVVMAACRVVDLKGVGGESMGVNSRGMEVDGTDLIPSEKLTAMRDVGDRNFKPKGVEQCDETCPACGNNCRWNNQHTYDHRCELDHQWEDGSQTILDPTAPWYQLEENNPYALHEWFEALSDDMRDGLLADSHIADFVHWSPTDAEYDEIKNIADTNLHSLSPGGETEIVVAGVLLIIGSETDYDPKAVFYINRQRDRSVGAVTLKKGAFGASYQISGLPSGQVEIAKQVLADITDKKLVFV